MNADAKLSANGVDEIVVHIPNGEENNVANPDHPTSGTSDQKCLQKCHVYSCKQLGL